MYLNAAYTKRYIYFVAADDSQLNLQCQNSDETKEHLFMECEFSKGSMDTRTTYSCRGMESICSGNYQQIQGEIPSCPNFQVDIYTEFVHSVWIERKIQLEKLRVFLVLEPRIRNGLSFKFQLEALNLVDVCQKI